MFYLNTIALNLYQKLKKTDPTNNALNPIKFDTFSVAEPCFIKEECLLPIIYALHETKFYQCYELKWLVEDIKNCHNDGLNSSPFYQDNLSCVTRSYIYNAPTLDYFIARIIEDFMFCNRAMYFVINAENEYVQLNFRFTNAEQAFNPGCGPLFFIAYAVQLFFGTDVKIDSFFSVEHKFDIETYQSHISGTLNVTQGNYLRFKKNDFKRINIHHNSYVDDGLKSVVDRLRPNEPDLKSIKDKVLAKIQRLYLETNGYISAAKMASLLNMSKSTLYRKLEAENTSFREVVEMSKKEIARKLIIKNTISLSEISDQLGYSNLTGFNRAFKRWFDISPSDYRRNLGM